MLRLQFPDGLRIGKGLSDSDNDLIPLHHGQVGSPVVRVRSQRSDLHNNPGAFKQFPARGDNSAPFLGISRIRVSGFNPGSAFNMDLHPPFLERRNNGGNQGHPLFTGKGFFGNADNHESRRINTPESKRESIP